MNNNRLRLSASLNLHCHWWRCPNHSVNSSSHSVNSDIAIQWEWPKFEPLQNRNPLTDYDKTLHNWLRSRIEYVTSCQSDVRERLVKHVKYKASLIYFYMYLYFYFFTDSRTEVTSAWSFTRDGSKHALWRTELPFGVHAIADNILLFKFPKNRRNNGLL